MGTVGGTAQGHQRDAPPSVHRPDGPPRPPHLTLPRPAPPAPRPHPRLAQEHGTHDERTTTQGRTTFVTSERASLLPEPRGERDLPAPQARAPAGGSQPPLRAASYHQPRHQRTRLGHLLVGPPSTCTALLRLGCDVGALRIPLTARPKGTPAAGLRRETAACGGGAWSRVVVAAPAAQKRRRSSDGPHSRAGGRKLELSRLRCGGGTS